MPRKSTAIKICRLCGGNMSVASSIATQESGTYGVRKFIVRRRVCDDCDSIIYTKERIVKEDISESPRTCPICKINYVTIDSRVRQEGKQISRRKKCPKCGKRISTREFFWY